LAKDKEFQPHQPHHPPTKRQLSAWQKQARRQRFIAIGFTLAILVALGIAAYAGITVSYIPMHQTVVEVNGQKFNMAYYIDAVKYYDQIYFSGNTQYISYILDAAEQNIEQFELMKEGAAKLGITVSDDEVNKQITDNSLPNNQAVRDIIRGGLLRDKLLADYFGLKIPTSGDQRDVIAMFLESQDQADAVKAQVDAGADFAELAATDSLDSTTQGDSGAVGAHAKGVFDYLLGTTGFDDVIFAQNVGAWGSFTDAEKTKQVGYWLVKITDRKSDNSQVHVSGILVGSEEEALSVKAQIDAGGDFTTLAQKYSQKWSDTAKDDLGWIASDATDVFKDYVFDATNAVGSVSAPIKDTTQSTKGGVWLFKALSSETKDTSADDKTDLNNQAFNAWITAMQKDTVNNKIVNNLDDKKKAYATTQAGG
jgi:parvulin-like peptidyl-prolyl isomerase